MIEAVTQITREDIRNLLKGYAAAIELDQIRVDALPPTRKGVEKSFQRRDGVAHVELIVDSPDVGHRWPTEPLTLCDRPDSPNEEPLGCAQLRQSMMLLAQRIFHL
jgi:hypothetical protein